MAVIPKILVFAGSVRSGAYSGRTADVAQKELAMQGAEVTRISLADYALPILDEDFEKEKGVPENAVKLGRLIIAHAEGKPGSGDADQGRIHGPALLLDHGGKAGERADDALTQRDDGKQAVALGHMVRMPRCAAIPAHPAHPVDRVLEQRRYRAIVFGRRDQQPVMSKSSPPRKVSPLVDFTSNTPSPISRMEMSKVPPPRS